MATARGGNRATRVLRELARKLGGRRIQTLRVGFLEDAHYADGTSVALVAAINNFGAPGKGIPARPFFTNMVLQNKAGWAPILRKLVVNQGYDAKGALTLLGGEMQNQLVASIQQGGFAANSPVTDLLKWRFPLGRESGMTFDDVLKARADVKAGETAAKSFKPLIWSGVLWNSTNFDVRDDV